jgi:hypothetical protein
VPAAVPQEQAQVLLLQVPPPPRHTLQLAHRSIASTDWRTEWSINKVEFFGSSLLLAGRQWWFLLLRSSLNLRRSRY